MGTTQGCYMSFWTNPWSNALQNNSCVAIYFPSQKTLMQDEQDMNILLWTTTHEHTCQKISFISSVQTPDVIYWTYQEQCPVGMNGKKESKESMLLAHLDFDDDDLFFHLFVLLIYKLFISCHLFMSMLYQLLLSPPFFLFLDTVIWIHHRLVYSNAEHVWPTTP